MESIGCIVCGNRKTTPYIEVVDRLSQNSDTFQLVKCDCNFVFLNPRPTESEIPTYYNSTEYDPHNVKNNDKWGKLYKCVQKAALRWKFSKIASFYPNGKLLDIGGGNGEFTSFMALKGWDVVLQDNLSNLNGINETKGVRKVKNLQMIKSTEHFNVITLWHSLEHIHNIKELFSNLNRMLTIDGILLIAVPNLKAPENTFYSTNWAPFDAPRHLYHFQLETLDNLIQKFNFKIVRKFSLFQDTPYNILLSMAKFTPLQFIKGIFVLCYSIIVTLLNGPDQSSSLLVICKKA